jgi:hypothetical protein
MKLLKLLPLTILLGICAVAQAQPGRGWTYLGEAHVDGAVDHDRIMVTAARGEYRAIRIRVENAAIEFDRVMVHFGNGTSTPIALRHRIRAGDQTRVIDLPGDRRIIESVEFWYARGNMRNPERPKLTLFGLH